MVPRADELDVLELLTGLIDKSLVIAEPAADGSVRYRLLESVRQYGRHHLSASADATDVRMRHASHFLALAEKAEPRLTGAEQAAWLARLESEHDNLRASLQWYREGEGARATDALRLAGALWLFWSIRGHLREGRAWLASALAADGGDPGARAKALHGAGDLAWRQSEYESARGLLAEALAIRRELGDLRGVAASLNTLGTVADYQGDCAGARALYEESLAICRELGDRRGVAGALNNLGLVAYGQGDHSAARALHEEAMSIKRELGNRRGVAMSLGNLGIIASDQGDYAAARALHEEALVIQRQLGDRRGMAITLKNLGEVAVALKDAAARASLEEALRLLRELGDRQLIAGTLELLARLALVTHDPERAAQLWGAAVALREAIGAPIPPGDEACREQDFSTLRAELGDAGFERAFGEGRARSWEQMVELALGSDDPR